MSLSRCRLWRPSGVLRDTASRGSTANYRACRSSRADWPTYGPLQNVQLGKAEPVFRAEEDGAPEQLPPSPAWMQTGDGELASGLNWQGYRTYMT